MSLDRSDRAQLEDILERQSLGDVLGQIRAIYRKRTDELRRQTSADQELFAARHGITFDLLTEARQAGFAARLEIEGLLGESTGLALAIEMGL